MLSVVLGHSIAVYPINIPLRPWHLYGAAPRPNTWSIQAE